MKIYQSILDRETTEEAVEYVKTCFASKLADKLSLSKVSAPLLVIKGTGINDDLNGIESPVSFPVKDIDKKQAEVVHSLAKWKRLRLRDISHEQKGIFTDMRAIRPDEELSPIHSICVDQWDWEKTIATSQRTVDKLKSTVSDIYHCLKYTEDALSEKFPGLTCDLPEEIKFIYADDLAIQYPDKTPKEREYIVTKEYGAVFLMGIGGVLGDGKKHDGRAADYDDWSTKNSDGKYGLNGDILVWNKAHDQALELSSMGIRVDAKSLIRQLEICKCEERKELYYHKLLLDGKLPQTMGGGIGQSRLCMFLLKKLHIGEVQSSIWSDEVMIDCEKKNIRLL